MKLLHISDLHLGKSLGDFDLINDQRYILDQILDIADKNSVDAMLIAGDVYDKSVPSEAATRLLNYFLNELTKRDIKTYMISGNHDSDERLNYGSDLFASNEVYISAIFNPEAIKSENNSDKNDSSEISTEKNTDTSEYSNCSLYHRTLADEFGNVNIYLLPFVKASQVRHYFPDEKIENYDDAVRVIIDHARIDRSERNVIVAHQFVAGKGADPEFGGSESVGAINVGLVERIGYERFDGFDYAALGHIHRPQPVGRAEVRYSGSPLKYSLSEVNNSKTAPLITLGEKGDVNIELIPLTPLRDMRHIRGTLKELLSSNDEASKDDFIYATLTDEEIINDAMAIFQQTYPNTVKISYDNSRTRELEKIDIAGVADNKSFDDLISDFYRLVYGCEIGDEEMAVMKMAAREAGVINEAD